MLPLQASWRRLHPDWEFRLWTDADNRCIGLHRKHSRARSNAWQESRLSDADGSHAFTANAIMTTSVNIIVVPMTPGRVQLPGGCWRSTTPGSCAPTTRCPSPSCAPMPSAPSTCTAMVRLLHSHTLTTQPAVCMQIRWLVSLLYDKQASAHWRCRLIWTVQSHLQVLLVCEVQLATPHFTCFGLPTHALQGACMRTWTWKR